MTPEEFEAGWRRWHGQGVMAGWGLSFTRPEAWTRFHALPDSKEYLDTPAEMAIYLERAEALIAWLFPDAMAAGFSVSTSEEVRGYPDWIRFVPLWITFLPFWTDRWRPFRLDLIEGKRRQHKWEADGLKPGFVWSEERAFNLPLDDEYLMRAYIGPGPAKSCRQKIFEDLAHEREFFIVWHAPDTGATFIPYHGGFDVFLETADERDAVREEFSDWLPVPGKGYPSHLDVMDESEAEQASSPGSL
ncbi:MULTISPECIES: hypothetical protein [unclassified Oceanicaulis]|uniref:DUF3885 domain-containing protein n=1 Tax=unclassified Oceanicaulis TaxID=2632123 RepID=UPI0025CDF0E9|nr:MULTISPECIES: hypothetical protein [unclassified Oceanicaulis]|tara:strand:+ start:958 stop:1695 length:738 start_codon:yes stop_codon:yes gene_type:complete